MRLILCHSVCVTLNSCVCACVCVPCTHVGRAASAECECLCRECAVHVALSGGRWAGGTGVCTTQVFTIRCTRMHLGRWMCLWPGCVCGGACRAPPTTANSFWSVFPHPRPPSPPLPPVQNSGAPSCPKSDTSTYRELDTWQPQS